jgi:hypothetical protein
MFRGATPQKGGAWRFSGKIPSRTPFNPSAIYIRHCFKLFSWKAPKADFTRRGTFGRGFYDKGYEKDRTVEGEETSIF